MVSRRTAIVSAVRKGRMSSLNERTGEEFQASDHGMPEAGNEQAVSPAANVSKRDHGLDFEPTAPEDDCAAAEDEFEAAGESDAETQSALETESEEDMESRAELEVDLDSETEAGVEDDYPADSDDQLGPLESELDTLCALESTGLDDDGTDDIATGPVTVEAEPAALTQAAPDTTAPDRTGLSKAGPGKAGPGKAGPGKAGPGKAGAEKAAGRAGRASGESGAEIVDREQIAAGSSRTDGSDAADFSDSSASDRADDVEDSPSAAAPAAPAVPENTFRALRLAEPLLKALAHAGYTEPTPIQAETIPLLLAGRDLLGQAQTGTGKTAAFALPMLQRIELATRQPQVLVLTPTRELAIQVCEAFAKYAAGMAGFRVAAIYGGQDYMVQFRALDRGVHVVVGTPGRVMDHMRRGSLQLARLHGIVLDEADEMLRMGFAEDVEWILGQVPAERQIALFSATLPEPIRRIAQQHLRNPAEITIQQRTATADTVRQRYIVAHPEQKDEVLHRVLEAETIDGVIVFVKMKSTTEPLADFLCQRGHRAAALNGDMAQGQRERIVEALKAGKLDIVVATDVAARGLDVQRISHVVNFDLPFDSEAYVHRIGRTGRAGRQGEAILLVTPREQGRLRRIEYGTRHPIEPMDPPSNRVINKRRVAKFHQRINDALARTDLATFSSIVDQFRRDKETPIEQIAAALAILACSDKPMLMTGELEPARFPEPRSRRRFDDRRPGDRRYDDRRPGDRRFDDRRNDDRRFDDRRPSDRRYSERRSDEPRSDERRFEDRRGPGRRFEGQRFEGRPSEGQRFEGQRFEGRRFEERQPEPQPIVEQRLDSAPRAEPPRFDDRPRDERPRDERPRDDRPRDERPRDERPRDDRFRDERYPRRESGRFEPPARGGRRSSEPMRSFRVEVGNAQQVKAGNLVGAIANETGMPSNLIGRIAIFDDFSIIDLPARMPRDVFLALRELRVAGKPLNPTPVGGPPRDDQPGSGPRPRFEKRPPFEPRSESGGSDQRPRYEKRPRPGGKPPFAKKPFRGKPKRDS